MNLLNIAFSNIKKRKSNSVTLLAIAIVAALVLSISLSLILNVGSFYDRKRAELNTPDYSILVMENAWQDSMIDYAQGYNDVEKVEVQDVYIGNLKFNSGATVKKRRILFIDENAVKTMNTLSLVDKLDTKPTDSIILPLYLKYNGYTTGNKFIADCGDFRLELTVFAFFEDAELGGSTRAIKTAYVNSGSYNEISQDKNFAAYKYLSLMLGDIEMSYDFQSDFLQQFSLSASNSTSIVYDMQKSSATMFVMIIALVLILVGIVITMISLIIVRFSIKNNIEEDIKILGAMKSVGFTSKQIILSILFQFLAISLAGSIIGVLLAFITTGFVGNIVSSTSGLLWSSTSFFLPAILTIILVIGITALAAYLVARKSKTITPINALRDETATHKTKRNAVSLDKTKLDLNISMAMKNFFMNIKTNALTFVIVFLFAFLTVLSSLLYHNFAIDNSALMQMIGRETADIQVIANQESFALNNFDDIKSRYSIVKTLGFDVASTTSDGNLVRFNVWEDLSKRNNNTISEGRYPQSDNEISLTARLQKTLSKKINDSVDIEFEGITKSYLVTGITQGIGDSSYYCDMTFEGYLRLKSDFVPKGIYIYLDNSDFNFIDGYVNSLTADYGRNIVVLNYAEMTQEMMANIKMPVTLAAYLIAGVTIFVVCFVLFLLINTIIKRRKKEFGIMKAIGFSNKQLILQMLFAPMIIIGVLLGSILGVLITNPLIGVLLGGMGLAKPAFAIPVMLTTAAEITLLCISFLTIYLISLKMRNITPQKLITE